MEEKHEHHAHNCFNLARSNSITLDRDIPDARAPECRQQTYPTDLPQTSVVFVFYNEPLSPLFRSIHSVLNRSPPHLLKEIILVDDGSDAEWTQAPLEAYIKLLYGTGQNIPSVAIVWRATGTPCTTLTLLTTRTVLQPDPVTVISCIALAL